MLEDFWGEFVRRAGRGAGVPADHRRRGGHPGPVAHAPVVAGAGLRQPGGLRRPRGPRPRGAVSTGRRGRARSPRRPAIRRLRPPRTPSRGSRTGGAATGRRPPLRRRRRWHLPAPRRSAGPHPRAPALRPHRADSRGTSPPAVEALEEGARLARRQGDEAALANFLHELGSVVRARRRRRPGADATSRRRPRSGAGWAASGLAMSLGALGMLAGAARATTAAAGALLRESVADLAQRVLTGSLGLIGYCSLPLEGLAVVALRGGRCRRGRRRLAAAGDAMARAQRYGHTFTTRYRFGRLRGDAGRGAGAARRRRRAPLWEPALAARRGVRPGGPRRPGGAAALRPGTGRRRRAAAARGTDATGAHAPGGGGAPACWRRG